MEFLQFSSDWFPFSMDECLLPLPSSDFFNEQTSDTDETKTVFLSDAMELESTLLPPSPPASTPASPVPPLSPPLDLPQQQQQSSTTTAGDNTSIGNLYCHVCNAYRTLDSYWNCLKNNHLVHLFVDESQSQSHQQQPAVLRSDGATNTAVDASSHINELCNSSAFAITQLPVVKDYTPKQYDDTKSIIRKIKLKKLVWLIFRHYFWKILGTSSFATMLCNDELILF